ncbi:MAG: hypothetical protein AAFY83_06545 [Pseudomonadota bacterium]
METISYGAVLTGDFVGSSKLTAAEMMAARRTLEQVFAKVASAQPSHPLRRVLVGEPDFFRGDSWQALIDDPVWCLRAAVFIRARLMADNDLDCRVSIAVGDIESVDKKKVSMSLGEAFSHSGMALDGMKTRERLIFHLCTQGSERAHLGMALAISLAGGVRLVDALVTGWTRKQADAVSHSLLAPMDDLPTFEMISNILGVSRQTVQNHYEAAHWPIFLEYFSIFDFVLADNAN